MVLPFSVQLKGSLKLLIDCGRLLDIVGLHVRLTDID
jgi:hypothetical protein